MQSWLSLCQTALIDTIIWRFFLARCDVLHPVPCQRNLPSLTV